MMTRSEKGKILEKEIKKEEQKKHIHILIKLLIIFLILLIGLLFYMHYFGTKGLEVREYKVSSKQLPDSFHGFKIVQFSDVHYLTTIKKKEFNHIINKINELKPDIIVFTGDLLDQNHVLTEEDRQTITKSLNKLKATTGYYAIKGNHDYENKDFETIFQNTKFKILNNTYEFIYYKGNTPILLAGVNSVIKNDCDYNQAFNLNETNDFYTVMLLHEPDIISSVTAKYRVNLALAGHTHNGQVRIPGIGAILKVPEGKKYPNEHYQIQQTNLYVSGGLGTSIYEFRWFNKPSINLYRLTKEN